VLLPARRAERRWPKWWRRPLSEIDLKVQTAGRFRTTSTGKRGTGLFDISELTGLPWPTHWANPQDPMASALAAGAPAKIVRITKPNGPDLDHQPTPAHQLETALNRPANRPARTRANCQSAARASGDEKPAFLEGRRLSSSRIRPSPNIIPPALNPPQIGVSCTDTRSGVDRLLQGYRKIALARPGAWYEEQFLLALARPDRDGKIRHSILSRDDKKTPSALPCRRQQVQSTTARLTGETSSERVGNPRR